LVDEFVAILAADPSYPPVTLIHQGVPDQSDAWFGHLGTFDGRLRSVSDPDAVLYRSYGVERGGWRAMFGLRAWRRGISAFFRGHLIGRKVGDAWTLPTVLVVRNGEVVWSHRGEHAGDHPEVGSIPRLAGVVPVV
jgi:hypothetical protein